MSSILKKRERVKGTFGETTEGPNHHLQLCRLYSAPGVTHRKQGNLKSRLGPSSQPACLDVKLSHWEGGVPFKTAWQHSVT